MEKVNFEESIEKLENIAIELEKGELSLEESLTKFEEGMKLSKQCNEIIENAEKKNNSIIRKRWKIRRAKF